jgi:hypothetical protein
VRTRRLTTHEAVALGPRTLGCVPWAPHAPVEPSRNRPEPLSRRTSATAAVTGSAPARPSLFTPRRTAPAVQGASRAHAGRPCWRRKAARAPAHARAARSDRRALGRAGTRGFAASARRGSPTVVLRGLRAAEAALRPLRWRTRRHSAPRRSAAPSAALGSNPAPSGSVRGASWWALSRHFAERAVF